MLKILICVSGGGTNFQAIIDAVKDGRISASEIVGVISSSHTAKAIERAKNNNIPVSVVCKKDFENEDSFNEALVSAVKAADPDLIVLAGFLTVLPSSLTELYPNRIINIHPALIPSFCGKGYYGLKVHEEALKRGVKVTGATVHFVDSGCDSGPIIMQKAVPVMQGDTPEILQRRVMEQAEWVILPMVIDYFAKGKIEVKDNLVYIN
ncbi:MAG: phosphoribosylglycinamide formyltransferase [Lachnospiraceae bacterium]|nr:phosphoribosylglycinamide formyltransferase [Lachnospiraceae bacterium]